MKKAALLGAIVIIAGALFPHSSGPQMKYASLDPIESRVIHLRMGSVVNTTIMNGTSFRAAMV